MENNTTVSLTINPLGYQHKNEKPETKTIRFQYPEGYNKQKFFADGLEKSFPAVQADQFVKIGIAVLIGDEVAETTEGQGTPETTDGDIKEVPAVNADAANVTEEVKEAPKQKAVEAPKAKGSGKK